MGGAGRGLRAARHRTLFRSDHYMNLDGQHPERGSLDAWATLCGLAAITSTLRLGTMVSPATFRHPSELAKVVVTADHISGGRIDLGLGAGWHEREHAAYGFPFASTRTRMDVLEEQLQVIHGAWGEGPFSFAGQHYTLEALEAQPKPVQRPHPPVIMGGNAGPRAAALAARYADEYNTAFPDRGRRSRAPRAHTPAPAPRPAASPLPFSVMTAVLVGRDEAELRDRAGRLAEKMGDGCGQRCSTTRPPAGSWARSIRPLNSCWLCARPALTESCASSSCTRTSTTWPCSASWPRGSANRPAPPGLRRELLVSGGGDRHREAAGRSARPAARGGAWGQARPHDRDG